MKLWRKKRDDLRVDTFSSIDTEDDARSGKKKKERARKDREEAKLRK